jgi:hypothetical protein
MRRATPIRGATDEHEAAIAIATIDKTLFIDFKPDARMAQCGWHFARSIAGDAVAVYADSFGRIDHKCADSNRPNDSPP